MRTLAGGRYALHAELGRGGMAVVWQAWDRRLRAWRAVKVLVERHPEHRARFEREVHAMARLHHPHILAIHDVVEDEGDLCLVTDLALGGSLADWLEREGRMPLGHALSLAIPLARALAFAHARGVVHRDVKPGNVLLMRDGRPVVTDFGIARVEHDPRLTDTGMAFGTPAYMAPEQRRSATHADGRADVYALGATLWQLLTGRMPWNLDRGPPIADEVPGALAEILARATAYAPADRPDAEAFAGLLEEVAGQLTVDPDPRPLVPPDLAEPPPPAVVEAAPRRWARLVAGVVTVVGLAAWWMGTEPGWTLVAEGSDPGRRYARDGSSFQVVDGQVLHEDEPLGDADAILDAAPDRVLVRRAGEIAVLGTRGVSELVLPDTREPTFLDPRGGILRFARGTLRERAPTGEERVLLATGRSDTLAATPSGRRLAWVNRPSPAEVPALVVFDRDTREQTIIVRSGALWGLLGPASLAFVDEERLAYTRAPSGSVTEVVLWTERGERVLTSVDRAPVALEPVPGGLRLVSSGFDQDIAGSVDVVRDGSDLPTDLLPDGTLLFDSDAAGSWDVWERSPDGVLSVRIGGPTHDAGAVVSGDRLLWLRTPHPGEVAVMVQALGQERELLRLPVEAASQLQGRPPPQAVALDCNDQGCVVCSRGKILSVRSLDPVTGELGPSAEFPGLSACALGPDGTVYASHLGELPASRDVSGRQGSLDLPLSVQTIRADASGRLLVGGQAPGGGWVVTWWAAGELQVLARSDVWLGEPRASDDGRTVAWVTVRSDPFVWSLSEAGR